MIEIKDLHVKIADSDTEILRGINLSVKAGEIHAIMGPNGSGKSTLSYVLAGKEDYEITQGSIEFMGKDLLEMEVDERAAAGLFLAFQYPIEIPGVATMTFLHTAFNAQRKQRGQDEMRMPEFIRLVRDKAKDLGISMDMLKRPLNSGFSGGEKKRSEILQMALLEPHLCVLDETDSGLDIDALKVVSNGVNALYAKNKTLNSNRENGNTKEQSLIVITHYQRLLDYIIPDYVHVLSKGKIVRSGGKELALELEDKGYADYGDQDIEGKNQSANAA